MRGVHQQVSEGSVVSRFGDGSEALPLYSHRNSPKKFTQHQLFACLVLKCFLKTDYRGVVAHLADCPSLAEAIELGSIPHYTTLQKAARRLLAAAPARWLLDATVREQLGRKRPRATLGDRFDRAGSNRGQRLLRPTA